MDILKKLLPTNDKLTLAIISLALTVLGVGLLAPAHKADALSGSGFNAGNIIDDAVFYNDNAMTVSQIQSFLNARVPTCDTNGTKQHWSGQSRADYGRSRGYPPPYVCLKNYSQTVPSITNGGSDLCKKSISGGNKSAARILHDVGKACGINPQVLIVMLQKEMSLVTDDWPWTSQYDKAMGYACPDSGPNNSANCDSAFFGFFNQVYNAAQAYRRYEANPTWYNYRAQRNNTILWHPSTSCGTSNVFIENQATASLYIYTPYRPNQAALNNLYGTGNSCSSYGNRNFWRMFNDWFGPTSGVEVQLESYDLTTDTDGDLAKIGVRLSKAPRDKVYVRAAILKPEHGEIIGSTLLEIPPENWNKPSLSYFMIKGLNDTESSGTQENRLIIQKVSSNDTRYNLYPVLTIEHQIIVHQDTGETPSVHRLYNSSLGQHLLTANHQERDEKVTEGWRDEGVKFSYCYGGNQAVYRLTKNNESRLAIAGSSTYKNLLKAGFAHTLADFSASSQGDVPVYWLYDEGRGRSIYSTDPNEGSSSGFSNNGIAFMSCSSNMRPVYQLRKPEGSWFYTQSPRERDKAFYDINYEFHITAFYSCESGSVPIYRLYRRGDGTRFYTVSAKERDLAIDKLNYRYEGVGFYLCPNGSTDVYRLYRSSDGKRFYTTSASQRDKYVKTHGFRYEGVGFRVK
ncbi:hypothetical protein BH23PAT2_BH23PAT2_03810 [soil metagenome]